jgi:hypothetical protein
MQRVMKRYCRKWFYFAGNKEADSIGAWYKSGYIKIF